MKALIHSSHTDIFPTMEEVRRFCKPGREDKTCVWMIQDSEGFRCSRHHKGFALSDKFRKGLTIAKRDGCDLVNKFDPYKVEQGSDYPGIEFEIVTE